MSTEISGTPRAPGTTGTPRAPGTTGTPRAPATTGTPRAPGVFDPDELADLEAERDFLLHSIDDLEAERAAGNLEPERYQVLHDDYTARAAAVLRAIEEGIDSRPVPPRFSRRRKVLIATALVGFAVAAGGLLTGALSNRSPGQTATGNQQTSARDRLATLQRRVQENPDDASAHLILARAYLETGEVAEAVREFDTAGRLDPTNAEALAYGGWVVFLAARSAPQAAPGLLEGAMRRLDAAVAAVPDYPDAHFFRGMVLFRGKGDPAGAVPEFERFLALVPDGALTEQVKELLELARADAKADPGADAGQP